MFFLNTSDNSWIGAPLEPLEEPEPEYTRSIEDLYSNFSEDIVLHREFTYWASNSSFTPDRASEPLRAIAGATVMAQNVHPGKARSGLMDGLTANLIREAFSRRLQIELKEVLVVNTNRGPLGLGRKHIAIPVEEFFDAIGDSASWDAFPESDHGTRMRTFYVQKNKELYFFNLLGRTDPSGRVFRLIGFESLSHFSRSSDLRSDMEEIFEDFSRRKGLAAAYRGTPFSRGFPAKLRAELKRELADIRIVNGDYSRIGFSSGIFPYAETVVRFNSGGYRTGAFVFHRCATCGAVERLSLWRDENNPKRYNDELSEALVAISERQIEPWHSAFCELMAGELERPRRARVWNGRLHVPADGQSSIDSIDTSV